MILPQFKAIVFDEAHLLEDIATDFLGYEVSNYRIPKLLNYLYSKRTGKGFLPSQIEKEDVLDDWHIRIEELRDLNTAFFAKLEEKYRDTFRTVRLKEPNFVTDTLSGPLSLLEDSLEDLKDTMTDDESMAELQTYIKRCKKIQEELTAIITMEADETVYWYEYYSEDYGSAKGIDLNLSKQLSNFISGSASYSLSWANGNNSSTVVQDETTNLREFPLDWDTRHNFNFNMGFRIQNDEEFYLPFINVRVPFDDFSMNFLYNIASGSPYTGVNDEDTSDDINSSNKPYTSNAN